MSNAYANGVRVEKMVQQRLMTLLYKGKPMKVSKTAGADKSAHDIVVSHLFNLETKSLHASEGGGCTLRFRDGAFQLPEHPALREGIEAYGKPLWDGRIPSFLTGDRSINTWNAEKKQFPGIYIPVGSSAVADYYQRKGTQYIYVQGKGLYHTGEDPLELGVPKFELPCRIRIRLKQHHSNSVPQDAQACFNYKIRGLPKSPYDFMDPARLPPGFTEAESEAPTTPCSHSSHTTTAPPETDTPRTTLE